MMAGLQCCMQNDRVHHTEHNNSNIAYIVCMLYFMYNF